MLAYLNGLLVKVRDRLPQVFSRMPKAPYEIRRVPPEIEIGAPGGSAQAGTPDGSRPGIFFINLRDTAERSEEHTSELQSLMRISYAVFCLKKKTKQNDKIIMMRIKEKQTNLIIS